MNLIESKIELLRLKSDLLDVKTRLRLRVAVKAGFKPSQIRDLLGRWALDGSATSNSGARQGGGVSIDYSDALTGISSIDDVTKSLSEILGRTMENMDFIPEWTPQLYGTAVHVAFGTTVRLEGIRGIGFADVEHSFINGDEARHGEPGSIRTDVLLRNNVGDIAAIYDVKTGRSGLTPGRVREIRDHTGVQSSVPIIELSVLRGARVKAEPLQRKSIGIIAARLWRE